MLLLYFSGRNLKGQYHQACLGGQDIESCLEMLTSLVNEGWQLHNIRLSEYQGSSTWLPVEAFDGQSMQKPLKMLQNEWEEILYQN